MNSGGLETNSVNNIVEMNYMAESLHNLNKIGHL